MRPFLVPLSKNKNIVEQAEYVSVSYSCSKSYVLVGSLLTRPMVRRNSYHRFILIGRRVMC